MASLPTDQQEWIGLAQLAKLSGADAFMHELLELLFRPFPELLGVGMDGERFPL